MCVELDVSASLFYLDLHIICSCSNPNSDLIRSNWEVMRPTVQSLRIVHHTERVYELKWKMSMLLFFKPHDYNDDDAANLFLKSAG